jgi:predicted glycoside hydrolase/deacetylase ChbG (UPF0249 family)
VGLHLNLLDGAPLAMAGSLTDRRSGRFLPLARLVRRAVLGRIDAGEAAAECEAQLAALRDAGIRCTHIDSHRHTHAMPVIHRAVEEVAVRHGLPLRRPVESHVRAGRGFVSQLHRGVVGMSWRLSGAGTVRAKSADHFAGMSLQGDPQFGKHFLAAISALPPGTTEFMVHPGRVDDALTAIDGYTWQRTRELEALLSAPVRERLRRGDLELIGFGQL